MTDDAADQVKRVRREMEVAQGSDPDRMARWHHLVVEKCPPGMSLSEAFSDEQLIRLWDQTGLPPGLG